LRKRFKQDIAELLELPLDITLDVPRVVVIGDLGVLISNHRGLIQYSPQKLVIGVGRGQITISGEKLEIEEVSKEDMAVRGVIRSLEMNT